MLAQRNTGCRNFLPQRNTECGVTLLPSNSTELEKALEQAIKYNVGVDLLKNFKFKAVGNLNLTLSWEYSLAQINVDDFKQRIIEGLKFHRMAGTPYSLRQALSWYGLTNIKIEEEEVGRHFSEFQVGFDEIPDGTLIDKIVETAKLAAPIRSRLTRMYNNDYDIRRFVLDGSGWGDLLSDHSGIYNGALKLSFGKKLRCDASFGNYNISNFNFASKFSFAKIEDTFKLSFGVLDDTNFGQPTEHNIYRANKVAQNAEPIGNVPDYLIRLNTFSRAMIVLSDSVLEDGQSCFSGSYENKNDSKFILGFSYLSETAIKPDNIMIDVRRFEDVIFDGTYNYETGTTNVIYSANSVYESESNFQIFETNSIQHSMNGQYRGNNTWHDHRHFDVPWNQQNNYSKMVETWQ